MVDDLDSRDANGPYAIAADERLSWEREFLGMYLSDHPLRRIAGELQQRVDTTINELGGAPRRLDRAGRRGDPRHAHVHPAAQHHRSAHGGTQIEDLTGSVEVVVFARVFEECASVLRPDAVIVVRGKVEAGRSANGAVGRRRSAEEEDRVDIEPPQILAEAVYAYDDPRLAAWRRDSTVHVSVSARADRRRSVRCGARSRSIAAIARSCSMWTPARVSTRSRLRSNFSVDPGPALERAVEILVGENSYRVEMHRVRAPERERAPARR